MIRLNPSLTLAVVASAVVGVTTAATNPQFVGFSYAFAGGLIGGAGIATEKSLRQKQKSETATRVASCFAALYEANKGIVDPTQLGVIANIPFDLAHAYLTDIAERTNGQKISVKQGSGAVFVYPHTQSALDELTTNAKNWADAQTKQLNEELNQHKQALQFMRLQQASAAVPKTPAPTQSPWENVSP